MLSIDRLACGYLLCLSSSILVLVLGCLLERLSATVIWASGLAFLVNTVGQKEIVRKYETATISIPIFQSEQEGLIGPLFLILAVALHGSHLRLLARSGET
jgi:hypothetical protein